MALKVYNLTTYEDAFNSEKMQDSSGLRYNYSNSTLMILHPTIAFQWQAKNNNFHEAELTNLMLRKINTLTEAVKDSTDFYEVAGGTQITNTFVSVRYEYIMNFAKKNDRMFVPSIGFGANPYLQREKNLPKVSNAYRTAETTVGMRTYLTPRITWYFSPKPNSSAFVTRMAESGYPNSSAFATRMLKICFYKAS